MFINKFIPAIMIAIASSIPVAATDSLVVSPAQPTTKDSIQLSIIFKGGNICCTYLSQPTPSSSFLDDSTINLNVNLNQEGICVDTLCALQSKVLTYNIGTLPAGTYSVYETDNYVYGALMTGFLIGHFTVTPSASVASHYQKPILPAKTASEGRAYDIRGALIHLASLGATRRIPGVYFIKSSNNAAMSAKVIF